MKIGIISDTHGLLRSQAVDALAYSDLILHAGDIGKPAVLEALKAIAPVIAVRSNNDHGSWAFVSSNAQFHLVAQHFGSTVSQNPQPLSRKSCSTSLTNRLYQTTEPNSR